MCVLKISDVQNKIICAEKQNYYQFKITQAACNILNINHQNNNENNWVDHKINSININKTKLRS